MIKNNLLSKHAKSFKWASFFLSSFLYEKISIIYDFCRTVDDIADQSFKSLEQRKYKLNEFKKKFRLKNDLDNITKRMWNLLEKENISKNLIEDLFDGISTDLQQKVKINSRKELLVYCYRVAGTVGLMMARILKVQDKNSLKGAIDLGIAMQLTNIARDVVEDKKMSREYINDDFQSIVNTIGMADNFYRSSFTAIKSIPLKNRFSIIVARRVYREIGYKILNTKSKENYNKSGKIYISIYGKIIQTFLSVLDIIKLAFMKIENHKMIDEHNAIREEVDLNERI
jgi:phytoene synthase